MAPFGNDFGRPGTSKRYLGASWGLLRVVLGPYGFLGGISRAHLDSADVPAANAIWGGPGHLFKDLGHGFGIGDIMYKLFWTSGRVPKMQPKRSSKILKNDPKWSPLPQNRAQTSPRPLLGPSWKPLSSWNSARPSPDRTPESPQIPPWHHLGLV